MLLPLVLMAVVSRSRNTEVAIEPTGMVCPESRPRTPNVGSDVQAVAVRDPKRCRMSGAPRTDRHWRRYLFTNSTASQIGIFTGD